MAREDLYSQRCKLKEKIDMKRNKFDGSITLFVTIFFSLLIIIGLVFRVSTIVYISTGIENSDRISSSYRLERVPIFTFLNSKPSVADETVSEHSPIFGINYSIKIEGEKTVEAFADQIKADVITVKIPYHQWGIPPGNVSIVIDEFNYGEVLKVGR